MKLLKKRIQTFYIISLFFNHFTKLGTSSEILDGIANSDIHRGTSPPGSDEVLIRQTSLSPSSRTSSTLTYLPRTNL